MASVGQSRGTKRSKSFYRKSAYGAKKQCTGGNRLEPGIRGFLVTCNHDERGAVRESYNILNEYADNLYGPDKNAGLHVRSGEAAEQSDDTGEEEECDDVEKALEKEVEELKRAAVAPEKRFQNVSTKAKNCVFIRTSLANPVEVTTNIMEDIAKRHLKKARYAARILPILGTCKANSKEIEKLASDVLKPIFSKQTESDSIPTSFTVLFKMRNNNGSSCGRESVIPAVTKVVQDFNPDVKFSWTDYSIAIIIEVVCTVCCLGVAPDYSRLRKYNLQELQQGAKDCKVSESPTIIGMSKNCDEHKNDVDVKNDKDQSDVKDDKRDNKVVITTCDEIEKEFVVAVNNDAKATSTNNNSNNNSDSSGNDQKEVNVVSECDAKKDEGIVVTDDVDRKMCDTAEGACFKEVDHIKSTDTDTCQAESCGDERQVKTSEVDS